VRTAKEDKRLTYLLTMSIWRGHLLRRLQQQAVMRWRNPAAARRWRAVFSARWQSPWQASSSRLRPRHGIFSTRPNVV